MVKTEMLISMIRESNDYEEKTRAVMLILSAIEHKKLRMNKKTRALLSDFAIQEMNKIESEAEKAAGYRQKSNIFKYADVLFGVVMASNKTPEFISREDIAMLDRVATLMKKEGRIEDCIDDMFSRDIISLSDIDTLIQMLRDTDDEYAKGLLYSGFLHYKDKLVHLLESAKKSLSEYISCEMKRYISEYGSDEDKTDALENACDLCAYLPNEDTESVLLGAISLGNGRISYYAIISLLKLGKDIPEETVAFMAHDLVHAYGLYHTLAHFGKESLFPKELANEEYIAKSDLVHWLTFPTELGKAPDEIEYLGKAEVKKETYHIFRFRSDSENLGEDLKDKWLIGWSGNDGGTFSKFDLYEKYEKKTPEETVKYIKKKIL